MSSNKKKNVSLSTQKISENNTPDVNDIGLIISTPIIDTTANVNKPVKLDSVSDNVSELSLTPNTVKPIYEEYSIDFEPILGNLEGTIHQFLEERLNQQKECLTQDIYQQVRNQLTKQLNGEKNLFTPDYQSDFYQKFMDKFNEKFSTPSLGKPRLPNLTENLESDEYIISIIGDYGMVQKTYNSQTFGNFNFLKTITNKLNIREYSNKSTGKPYIMNETKHNLILNDLQIDLVMKLSNTFKDTVQQPGKNQPPTIINNTKLETLLLECNNLKQQLNLLNSKVNQLIPMDNIALKQLWSNIHNKTKPVSYLPTIELRELANKYHSISEKMIWNSIHSGFQEMRGYLPHEGMTGIYCKNNHNITMIEVLYNLYDDVIDHLVYMFKTYWNGKIISPYAKQIQKENHSLHQEAIRVNQINKETSLKLKKLEEYKTMEIRTQELKTLTSKHTTLLEQITKERELIEHQNTVNNDLVNQLKYLEEERKNLDQLNLDFKKQQMEFKAEKVKLVHFKRRLHSEKEQLDRDKCKFEREKSDLFSYELETEQSESLNTLRHNNIAINIDS